MTNNYELENINVLKVLQSVQTNPSNEALVPVGSKAYAFWPATKDSDKVIVGLGGEIFIEATCSDAIEIIKNRFKRKTNGNAKVQSLCHDELIESREVKKFEMNENGQAFVDINGADTVFHDSLETIRPNFPEKSCKIVNLNPIINNQLAKEDLLLLERIRAIELEEQSDMTGGIHLDDLVIYSESDLESIQEELSPYRSDSTLNKARGTNSSENVSKKVSFSNTYEYQIIDCNGKASIGVQDMVQVPKKLVSQSLARNPLNFEVIERESESGSSDEVGWDSDLEDDIELGILGKQVAISYLKKRQQMLSSGMLSDDEENLIETLSDL